MVTVDKTAPTANAGTDATITCTTPSTTLAATGGGTYAWSPATGLSATNIANPVATPTTTTTYTVTVTAANGCTATDEVVVTKQICDWGDLPDATAGTTALDYQTISTNNGPVHAIITGLSLGVSVDAETNGQASNDALGDGIDEDGFSFSNTFNPVAGGMMRLPINVTNTTGITAHLEIWIDWNADGDFADANEMVVNLSDNGLGDFGQTSVAVNIPADVAQNQLLGFRARLSHTDNMTPYGSINTGEVEDYLISIECKPLLCLPSTMTIMRNTND